MSRSSRSERSAWETLRDPRDKRVDGRLPRSHGHEPRFRELVRGHPGDRVRKADGPLPRLRRSGDRTGRGIDAYRTRSTLRPTSPVSRSPTDPFGREGPWSPASEDRLPRPDADRAPVARSEGRRARAVTRR